MSDATRHLQVAAKSFPSAPFRICSRGCWQLESFEYHGVGRRRILESKENPICNTREAGRLSPVAVARPRTVRPAPPLPSPNGVRCSAAAGSFLVYKSASREGSARQKAARRQ